MININEEELQCKICYEFLYETVLCDKCSNAFCQECAINYKNKAKKYGRIDKCPICGAKNFTFQRCEEIDKLIKKRKQKPLQCQHCKRIIFDKEKYEQHIEQCKYQCKFCLMVFDKEDDLLRHIKKKTNELFKALDLMNASRNKVVFNEGKPKKKKLIKKRTKEVVNNNLKEERNEKKEEKKEEKKVEKIKKEEEKEEKDEKEEEKEEDKEEDKEEKEQKIENNIFEINSDLSKKIVKKKVIKKKKKIMKKKSRVNSNSNTINYPENNINEGDLINHKINKTCFEDKLVSEMKKLNISAENNEKNPKMVYIKNRPLRMSENSKDHKHSNFSSNTSKGKDNKININSISGNVSNVNIKNSIRNSINIHINNNKGNLKEESKKETDKQKSTEKEEKEEDDDYDVINNKKNKKEQELIFSNSGKKNYNANNQVIEEEEKISRYVDYLNNPRPESVRPGTIPGEAKLNMEYDLYFCGKPNHIDCICCTEHKCKPGACMCISCMKLNKKYHKLKSHYLINKSGRACKYSHGFFHCYCNYTHIVHDVGNNIFKPVYKCQGENICKPCEEITLLMETYLPSTICQKLRDREARQAQF